MFFLIFFSDEHMKELRGISLKEDVQSDVDDFKTIYLQEEPNSPLLFNQPFIWDSNSVKCLIKGMQLLLGEEKHSIDDDLWKKIVSFMNKESIEVSIDDCIKKWRSLKVFMLYL